MAAKKPFACPLCGGPVWLELSAQIRCSVNETTGKIGKVRLYDSQYVNPGVHCDHCGRDFVCYLNDSGAGGRVVEIEQKPVLD